MSVEDEQAPETTQETPESAPDSGTRAEEPTQDTNWEERYQNLQPQFTRTTQRLSELELALKGSPEHAHLLEEYGLQWADDPDDTDLEDEDEDDDPITPLSREVQALREWQQQQEENADLAAFSADVERLAGDTKLSQTDREFILNRSVAHGWNSEATERAFKEWTDWRDGLKKQAVDEYLAEKTGVPRPGAGAAAVEKVDRSDPKQRKAYIDQRFAELNAEQ